MKFLPKGGQKRRKAVKISKEEVKLAKKVTFRGKFISKSTISSKGKAGEKQNLH